MPRVTRSQVDAIDHFPKPATPLAERNLAMGVNTIDDEVLASELKGLKAAYQEGKKQEERQAGALY
jgi:hypothetical protein